MDQLLRLPETLSTRIKLLYAFFSLNEFSRPTIDDDSICSALFSVITFSFDSTLHSIAAVFLPYNFPSCWEIVTQILHSCDTHKNGLTFFHEDSGISVMSFELKFVPRDIEKTNGEKITMEFPFLLWVFCLLVARACSCLSLSGKLKSNNVYRRSSGRNEKRRKPLELDLECNWLPEYLSSRGRNEMSQSTGVKGIEKYCQNSNLRK